MFFLRIFELFVSLSTNCVCIFIFHFIDRLLLSFLSCFPVDKNENMQVRKQQRDLYEFLSLCETKNSAKKCDKLLGYSKILLPGTEKHERVPSIELLSACFI